MDETIDQETKDFNRRLMDEAIIPNCRELAKIALEGNIAVVVFEIDDSAKPALWGAGWDGKATVFPMLNSFRTELAQVTDAVTASWLTRQVSKRFCRMFVFFSTGSLLINFTPQRGYWVEPGSLEEDWV
jgi:hypothetical protein